MPADARLVGSADRQVALIGEEETGSEGAARTMQP